MTEATDAATTPRDPDAARGVIHDLGYQHYEGVRLGRGAVFRGLYTASLRSAFGLGRGAKAKIIPFAAVGIMALPAAIAVVVAIVAKQALGTELEFLHYRDYAMTPLQWVVLGFLAVQAAELVCRDLRYTVLPLYFSRPIKRIDYPLAKLAAMATAVFIVMSTPLIVHYLGASFTTNDGLQGIWTETKAVAPILVSAGVHALVLGALGLAIASLTPRRAFAIGGIAAWYVLSNAVMGALFVALASRNEGTDPPPWPAVLSPFPLLNGFQNAALRQEPSPIDANGYGLLFIAVTVGFFAACVAVLIVRYRRVAQ
ncbi:MAG: ABC transporter permease [Actinomycetes bacterium]